ncbi:U1 small nuclear ribonucleoprotein A, putative [Perkinsus marinus ATCC 50983]|uniref:U1 small nuclear ribonucleoprotein A, putative n=1 Tax=Perkinsus marinus (strain ATCC 50983 / TXsc) TaxID=423536 RepID=C5LXY0_PERM5|nr:U1 small nuclear ribonucleoprotein A, putative [Perkinsus marinus ATCC 50983]EEQ98310.1 U1 small nuclear ribonucleoprotein A, putative [Perkinsus marinus ATCC 50983]|eukprot:XP_002765593.1 U1 small nuclear ribonucleoprotein A, putative [Perkinsus marinus ATCC 50983]
MPTPPFMGMPQGSSGKSPAPPPGGLPMPPMGMPGGMMPPPPAGLPSFPGGPGGMLPMPPPGGAFGNMPPPPGFANMMPMPGGFAPPQSGQQGQNIAGSASPEMAKIPLAERLAHDPHERPPDDFPPNETLYINNLNDRVKPEELKKSILELCKPCGTVIDCIAMRSLRRRGQVFVVFSSKKESSSAMKKLQGHSLYSKNMRVSYAKTKSDAIAKKEGTYVRRDKEKLREMRAAAQAKLQPEAAAQAAAAAAAAAAAKAAVPGGPMPGGMQQPTPPNFTGMPSGFQGMPFNIGQQQQPAQQKKLTTAEDFFNTAVSAPKVVQHSNVPNKTLFVENLPPRCTPEKLTAVFKSYPGFEGTRVIAERQVGFIDFSSEFQATMAKNARGDYTMEGQLVKISYARK